MTKSNQVNLTQHWLSIIDHFGEDAIKAELWHSTFAETRKYFENRMPETQNSPQGTNSNYPRHR